MGIKKTADFSQIATSQRSDFLYLVFQTCRPQRIAAQTVQGGVSLLTEQSDKTFSVIQPLLLTESKVTRDALLSTESIEVRPLVPKGILSPRQIQFSQFSKPEVSS